MRVRYSFSSRRTGKLENIKKQRSKFPELAGEIIRISDIILEVLDARFIEETRNPDLEKEIKKKNKKIIYVINKSDLTGKLERSVLPHPYAIVSCSKRRGISMLRNKIKAEVKKLDLKERRAQVGIIGYPNTGKSSLINLLSGRQSAGISPQAGFTKGIQKIRLTSKILILDTPGVISESKYSHTKKHAVAEQARISARTLDKIYDSEIVAFELISRYPQQIKKFYKIEADNEEDFVEKLGRKKNFLKKGGLVNEDRTCRLIISDWQSGKIKI